jgi:hypothetical protein
VEAGRSVNRWSIGGVSWPEVHRAGPGEEGPASARQARRAFLAVVRDQIVVSGNAVHGGREGFSASQR